MTDQGTTAVVLSSRYPQGSVQLHQVRNPPILEDGVDPRATFGYVQFLDANDNELAVSSAHLVMDDPELILIDFVPVDSANMSLWRVRLYGGVSGHAYRARIQLPDYAEHLVSIVLSDALTERPLITYQVIGFAEDQNWTIVGIVDDQTVTVTGVVGV